MSSVAVALLTSAVSAEAAKNDTGFKVSVKGKVGAAWYARLSNSTIGTDGAVKDGDANKSFGDKNGVIISDPKLYVLGDGGCVHVAYGFNTNLTASGKGEAAFQNMFAYVRLADMVEFRVGRMYDAMRGASVDPSDVLGATNGYFGSEWFQFAHEKAGKTFENGLALNYTKYAPALEIRSVRMAGVQAVVNYKPDGKASGFGFNSAATVEKAVRKGMLSAAVNYDNSFGNWRVQASIAGMFGLGTPTGVAEANVEKSAAYAVNTIISWKGLDFGLGFLDNLNTGKVEASKDEIAGRAIQAGLGYEFDVCLKPRFAVGGLYAFNGNGKADAAEVSGKAAVFFANAQITPRAGLKVFLEGGYDMYASKQGTAEASKFSDNSSFVIGTGIQVSQ